MRRKTRYGSVLLCAVALLCACSSQGFDHGEAYLNGKYSDDFTYVSSGDDVWSDKTSTYLFTDPNGKEVTVEAYQGNYLDNYGSALYDEAKQAELQEIFGSEYKVYLSSVSAYFSENESFASGNEYFKQCPTVNVKIAAKQSMNYDEIAELLLKHNREEHIYYSVVMYTMEAQAYDRLQDYYDEILPMSVTESESFSINKSNELLYKSWE